jgi:hypothetical protein
MERAGSGIPQEVVVPTKGYSRSRFLKNAGLLTVGSVAAMHEADAALAAAGGLPVSFTSNRLSSMTLPFLKGEGNAKQLSTRTTLEVAAVASLFTQTALLASPQSPLLGQVFGVSAKTVLRGVNQLAPAIRAKGYEDSNCSGRGPVVIVITESNKKCGKATTPVKAAAVIIQVLSALDAYRSSLVGNAQRQKQVGAYTITSGYAAKVSKAVNAKDPWACAQAFDQMFTTFHNQPQLGLQKPAAQIGDNPLIKLLTALSAAALIVCS